MTSIFTRKSKEPTKEELKKALDKTFEFWITLANCTKASYPSFTEGWSCSSAKYGWSFRIADKKRVIIFFCFNGS